MPPVRRRPVAVGQARAQARARLRRRLAVALAIVALLAVGIAVWASQSGGGNGPAARSGLLESLFQDDDHLIYASTPVVSQTLDQLRALGVDRVRLTVLWAAIAPQPRSSAPPAHFDARNPAAYPAQAWIPYDRVVLLARQRGIGVDFDLTAPGPLWAMAPGAPTAKSATHFRPDPQAFAAFATAVGRRYDGRYTVRGGGAAVTLPRVGFWTIWNEPNQPGWLYPQWQGGGGQATMESPRLYRQYAAAAFGALRATGHTTARDTILIGELAPEGSEASRPSSPIPPLRFLRALYCLDDGYRPLSGGAATAEGCPTGGGFAAANPALFAPSGFAHHPYSFFRPPRASLSDPNWAPLSDLGRLEHALDRTFAAYGVSRSLPLYLTEYGYETDPPDPFRGVPLATQAAYLDVAQHLAAADLRVRGMAQFLLFDAASNPAFPSGSQGYWSTFQTGLRFVGGAAKPSLAAYALPIDIARPNVGAGTPVAVWGMIRAAANFTTQRALVQWRPAAGAFRTVATVATHDPSGVLDARVSLPAGVGQVRLGWRAPRGGTLFSRAVAVRVG